jgi:phosphate transport system permease protein
MGSHHLGKLSIVVLPHTRVWRHWRDHARLGRALGETMAVTFVIKCVPSIGINPAPGTTISATIANEFTEAVGDPIPPR